MDIEKLYREYFTPVYRYTLSLVHDPDMAEEITQETFFRALKKINDYRRMHGSELPDTEAEAE